MAGATNNRGGDLDRHADAPTRPVYLPGMSPLRGDHGLDDAGGVAQAPKCSKVDADVAQKSKHEARGQLGTWCMRSASVF